MKKQLKALFLTSMLGAIGLQADVNIIPKPNSIKETEGQFFKLKKGTAIRYDKRLRKEAVLLARSILKATGVKVKMVKEESRIALSNEIYLDLADSEGKKESYTLKVAPGKVKIAGVDSAGAFYGTQSLLQLIPVKGLAKLPAVEIQDSPRFGWRGMHLDVGRHMYSIENLKKFIDQLAVHKLNKLHWHLTEDQGWRVEIKKYPKLTEIGAWRRSTPPYLDRWGFDNQKYGGYYTQEQIKDLVAYAKARHVTIMPEIDMPGHMAAAIASYPWLGNDDIPNYKPEVKVHWGVHPYTLAPKKETFEWVDNMLGEICELFPSQYIHIGGDEAPKDQWKKSKRAQEFIKKNNLHDEHGLQSYFIKQFEKMLEKRDRKLIGWDEIREGGLSPNATVMLWRGWNHAIHSINEGHDVVMAPGSHTYFDHYQNKRSKELAKGKEFEAIGGYRPLNSVYSFDPIPKQFQGTEKAKHVLGCQAQLWSEYMKTWEKLEYMAFPRIAALAEVAWTEKENKEYQDFRTRLDVMAVRYKKAGINAFDQNEFYEPRPLKGYKAKSSLKPHGDNTTLALIDGDPASFFWAGDGPKVGDTVTISFDKAKKAQIVSIKTGNPSTYQDRLEAGVLEISKDGENWKEIAQFNKGSVKAKIFSGTKHIRIRCTKDQESWLQVYDFEFQK